MKTFLIAEIGVNHDGDIEKAKRLILAAKASGADAAKFQTFKAEHLATISSPKAKYQEASTGIGTQYEMLKALELSHQQFVELKLFSDSIGIEFMSTPFDLDSLYFLVNTLQVKRIKLSSGDLTNLPLMYEVGKFKIPTIISTGGATFHEIDNAVIAWTLGRKNIMPTRQDFQKSESERIEGFDKFEMRELSILQCTTQYPASSANLNLNVIKSYLTRYPSKIGYSDHSIGYEASLAAVALGASVIEKHITESTADLGPDHSASMEIHDFKNLVDSIRMLEIALGGEIKYPTEDERQTISIARKSLFAARDILKDQIIEAVDLVALRPAGGLDPSYYWDFVGKSAVQNISKGGSIDEASISRLL